MKNFTVLRALPQHQARGLKASRRSIEEWNEKIRQNNVI
jgi:hypothetical protein